MFPVLFEIGPLTLYTYGFFVALGVVVAIFFARFEARRLDMNPDRIMDLCFYLVIAAIVGSRLFYVATNLDYFFRAPLDVFKIWNGGLVFYGGFIGAVIVAVVFVKAYKLPLGKTADIAGMAIPLGHTFGRIGCFFAGCCYGQACQLPWAITFHQPDSLAPLDTPVHPTQLYSAAGNLLIFLVLFSVRRRKRFDGQLFWLYIMSYGLIRSVIEIFRGDYRGGYLFAHVSISQLLGVSLAAAALVILIVLWRRSRQSDQSAIQSQ